MRNEDVAWYIIKFLDAFKEMSGISDDRLSELLNKYHMASNIEERFDDMITFYPEEYAEEVIKSLDIIGEKI